MKVRSDTLETHRYDLVILGSGLAGIRAALAAARLSDGNLRIALVTKLHAMRSHSVSAEGGISGVLYPGEADDTADLHAFDTVKGGDYLGDQPAIETLVAEAPKEIRFLDHLGTPWNRDEKGRIVLRAFGGMTVPRTAFAADKTGFFMMSALYDSLLAFPNIDVLHEHYATDLILKGGAFRGFLTLELATGQPRFFAAKSGIIATGGFARMYGFSTTAYSSTGDGIALAFKAGLPLKDMEFVQFHPTGLIPTGVLITEAARGEGGYLVDSQNRRFMEDYAKSKMELAPRDIVSRAMITELGKGRGLVHEVSGMSHLLLDMRHLGEELIDERLPMIKEIAVKLLGLNPAHDPLPVRPAAHYTMGGIHGNFQGQVMKDDSSTPVEGLWAAGECGCVSVHGANRLGSNSLSHCVVWGRITGEEAARHAMDMKGPPDANDVKEELHAACGRLDELLTRPGKENPYQIRRALWEAMDAFVPVYRDEQGLQKASSTLAELRQRFLGAGVSDPSEVFNTNLRDVLEIGSMLELAQTVAMGALMRKESRGSHARVEYPARDDVNFLKHTLAYRTEGLPRLSYIPVARSRSGANGKEVLMESRKRLTDLRGPQSRIGRLLSFSFEAYLHMFTNRVMVFLSLIYAACIAAYLLVPGLGTLLKILTVAVWLLWTPQFFEALKGLARVWSRGMAFGHLNSEFAYLYRKHYGKKSGAYSAFPFVVLALWAAAFVVMLARWYP